VTHRTTLKQFLCCGALAFSVAARAHECAAAPKEKTLSGVPPPPAVSLTVAPGREFAADSYVHKPLAPDALIDSRSANWLATLARLVKTQYGAVNIHQYTPPVYIAGPNQPTVRVKNLLLPQQFEPPRETYEPLQAQWLAVPLPDNFKPSAGNDKEAIVYQPTTGRYWEFWVMAKSGAQIRDSSRRLVDEWQAAWGGQIENLATNPGYFDGGFGTTATGMAMLGTLMTIEEQQRGVINHPLQLAVNATLRGRWTWPAQRSDGWIDDITTAIPAGACFRFPASLNLNEIDMHPYARMLARAVQRYGMYVVDTSGGGAVFRAENPSNQYMDDPYFKSGGILGCPAPNSYECWPDSNNRLRGFPWAKLQVLKVNLNN